MIVCEVSGHVNDVAIWVVPQKFRAFVPYDQFIMRNKGFFCCNGSLLEKEGDVR